MAEEKKKKQKNTENDNKQKGESVKSEEQNSAPERKSVPATDETRSTAGTVLPRPKRRGINLGNLLFGIFVIFIGFVFLGKSTGLYDIDIDLFQLWPLIVIFIGLSIMSRGGWVSTFVATIVTILVITVIGLAIYFGTGSREATHSKQIEIDREHGAKTAELIIDTGAGNLSINGAADRLVEGRFESDYLEIETDSDLIDDTQKVELKTIGNWSGFTTFGARINEMDLALDSITTFMLDINTGAMNMDIDLTDVLAERVDIKAGASSLDLYLGDLIDECEVNIDSGVSDINITLPKTVGAQIKIDYGLSAKDFKNFNKVSKGVYQSDNFETAEKKIYLKMKIGASAVEVEWD